MPTAWREWVQEPQMEEELKRIRLAVARGCPYGAASWQERTARRTGSEATLRPVGRPKKKDESAAKGASADFKKAKQRAASRMALP